MCVCVVCVCVLCVCVLCACLSTVDTGRWALMFRFNAMMGRMTVTRQAGRFYGGGRTGGRDYGRRDRGRTPPYGRSPVGRRTPVLSAAMGAIAAIGLVGAFIMNRQSDKRRKGKTVEYVTPPPSREQDGYREDDGWEREGNDRSPVRQDSVPPIYGYGDGGDDGWGGDDDGQGYDESRAWNQDPERWDVVDPVGDEMTTIRNEDMSDDRMRLAVLSEPVKIKVADGEWVSVERVMLDTGNLGPVLVLPSLSQKLQVEPNKMLMPVVSVGIHGDAKKLASAKATLWIKNVELDIVVLLAEAPLGSYELVVGRDVLNVLFKRGYVIGAY